MWRRTGLDKNARYAPGSPFELLKARFLTGVKCMDVPGFDQDSSQFFLRENQAFLLSDSSTPDLLRGLHGAVQHATFGEIDFMATVPGAAQYWMHPPGFTLNRNFSMDEAPWFAGQVRWP